MHFSFGEGHRDAQHPTLARLANAKGDENGTVDDLPAGAHLLVARIEHHVGGGSQ